MKAVQIHRFGGSEVFEIVETPTPAPGPGQVLVRVHAAGVNFAEVLMRENRYAVTPDLPAVLGMEVAGTVEAIGAGVGGLGIGARVAAPLFAAGVSFGGYTDHVLISADFVAPLPPELPFEDATALMVQGLTALHLTSTAEGQGGAGQRRRRWGRHASRPTRQARGGKERDRRREYRREARHSPFARR